MTPRERAEKLYEDFRERLFANKRPNLVDMLTEAIIEMREETVLGCPDHPKYSGLRTPRTSCEGCWRFYLDKKDRVNSPTITTKTDVKPVAEDSAL